MKGLQDKTNSWNLEEFRLVQSVHPGLRIQGQRAVAEPFTIAVLVMS